jgi:acyl-CoA synthetase (AMP-forming)/AMP-acid ligase II
MPQPDSRSLWDSTTANGLSPRRFVTDGAGYVALADLAERTSLGAELELLCDASVLISCDRQLPAVLALLQLDGIARRIVLCPPDAPPVHMPAVIADAQVNAIVSDGTGPAAHLVSDAPLIAMHATPVAASAAPPHPHDRSRQTEWLLFTSGTTGRPKIVVHTLSSLTGPLDDGLVVARDAIWSTFYDVRRYGGLQIMLRALVGGGSMVLSRADEAVADFLMRVGQSRVTHMSGTPSHWRRALMSPAVGQISPKYVRLSGEVADQAILNNLAVAFPGADIAHAFASTEAGVAFDVRDCLAGFPAALIGQAGAKAEMRVVDGSLRIRSARTASCYLGNDNCLADADGFVDTGDMLELRGDRYHFVGRREGVINVGGLKVHPEEVEAVINQHPGVQMARVRGRRNPITGAIVVAEIVLRPSASEGWSRAMKNEILEICRQALPAYKVPVMLRAVSSLDIAGSGKLVRLSA